LSKPCLALKLNVINYGQIAILLDRRETKMGIDVLIVDDNAGMLKTMSRLIEPYGLSYMSFESGWNALYYLRGLPSWEMPKAYFIDMKTANDVEHASKAELESPLEIYLRVKAKGADKYFIFLTGHLSPHDDEVIGETEARVLLKGDETAPEKIHEILRAIAADKTRNS